LALPELRWIGAPDVGCEARASAGRAAQFNEHPVDAESSLAAANATAFKRAREKPVGEGTFARWWRRCLDEAGVAYRNPHTARHTFATRWRRRGLGLDEIQLLLGHASIQTTSDLYVHTGIEDVASRMAELEVAL
jgi:integrase